MSTEKIHFDRQTIAQYVGVILFIVLLETHVVSRPVVFLLGPWIICLCLFVVSPSQFRAGWRRVIPIAGTASALGYLLMRYVFK